VTRFPAKKIATLKKRALVIQSVRHFFTNQGYLEVETPILCPTIIPEAHIDPVTCQGRFLQASPELCMKRLMAMGADHIFQISRCFRNNERGSRHLPELTLLEWYASGQTYQDLMETCEAMIRYVAGKITGGDHLFYQGRKIQLTPSWQRLSVSRAFEKYADKSMETAVEDGSFDEIICNDIEPRLGIDRPVFLYDYPRIHASLAKLKPGNPNLSQRFELYIAGIELANAFTELTDPTEQRKRFEKENECRVLHGSLPLPLPERFLADLKQIDDAAGIALGLDRLVMLLCDCASIDDVVAFTPEDL
jgi:lysyl-tRNA synthetase class 2